MVEVKILFNLSLETFKLKKLFRSFIKVLGQQKFKKERKKLIGTCDVDRKQKQNSLSVISHLGFHHHFFPYLILRTKFFKSHKTRSGHACDFYTSAFIFMRIPEECWRDRSSWNITQDLSLLLPARAHLRLSGRK